MKSGTELIAEERQRQIEKEGWTPEHDEQHIDNELARGAICYVWDIINNAKEHPEPDEGWLWWPWDKEWWKPTPCDPVRQLTKAGALIAAEIDRLQREERRLYNEEFGNMPPDRI